MASGRALIAMSGGVDSAAAAALMIDRGFECVGATMKLLAGGGRCCSLEDINDARLAAYHLGIPHYVLNFTEAFIRHVIEPFIAVYESGGTPNPCIECNRHLKFKLLAGRARQLEAKTLVTGHYAIIEKDGDRWLLKKGRDEKKDQSYVLYTMSQEELAFTSLPLGNMIKSEVREFAVSLGIENAKKPESQDICFVSPNDSGGPKYDYGSFIENWTGKKSKEGAIVGLDGKILGRHRGLIRYTPGQRRGAGVAANIPLYVVKKSAADNTLTLGPESSLYSKRFLVTRLNLIACDSIPRPLRLRVKTRYLQREQWACVEQTEEQSARVEFEEAQRSITAGQSAVFYDGNTVVGGGIIV
ncbi:MAG: tRNA 2-thiouridine(34) synthase MnmA [Treponema sp.]|jgi:tRNA-specific 2-thiouridylase|nr:tRNA 2-thiouridine(34) synthase MnmA [Treponema sp.]